MSKSQNMCYCLNSPQFVSCSQQAVIMYRADFWYLLCIIFQFLITFVFLIYTGEAKGQTRSGKRTSRCSLTQECITWFGLGVLYPCLSVYLSVKKKRADLVKAVNCV